MRKRRPERHRLGLTKRSAHGPHTKKNSTPARPSMSGGRFHGRFAHYCKVALPCSSAPSFFFFCCSFHFCNVKPTGTKKIILSGGAGPLTGWSALRISLESSPRAALIEPSSSSTIDARTALATAPLFLTSGMGLVADVVGVWHLRRVNQSVVGLLAWW